MVVFLVSLVALIMMRTLKNDYQKFAPESEELDIDRAVDESGWKLVQSDVFRAPPLLLLYCSLMGTGLQLSATVFGVLMYAAATSLYVKYVDVFLSDYSAVVVV